MGDLNADLLSLLDLGDPRRIALAAPGEAGITYLSLREQVAQLAGQLRGAGIARCDRVAIALPNGLAAVVAFLATASAAVAAPMNPQYKAREFQFHMADTRARALIVPEGGGEAARGGAGRGCLILEIRTEGLGEVRLSGLGRAAITTTADAPDPDDVALVLHTSGTTGKPKRVPLTHRNLVESAKNIAGSYELIPADVTLCVMPLFHVHGLVGCVLSSLLAGSTVIVPGGFNALSFWPSVRAHRVTWFTAVPSIHQMLLARRRDGVRPVGCESLRFIRSCSSALSASIAEELELNFGAPVLQAYGMTEAAHQIATNLPPPRERKHGTVGKGTNVSIAIMDEGGGLVDGEAQGEVVIRGGSVFGGYEENAEANAESFRDGWFRTGDEGVLDRHGYLALVGRRKELIVRGGEKVAPREVDEVLESHPSVAEAATFAVGHPVYGEEVAAAVVLRSEAVEEQLLAHCRDCLADFKCPKKIYLVPRIPRTDTGKIQRRALAGQLGV